MSNQKSAQRLLKRVGAWHADWVAGDMQRKLHFDKPAATFQQYLSGEDVPELLSLRAESLQVWHLVHFNNALLNTRQLLPNEFALSARYAHASVKFNEAFANQDRGGSIVDNDAALYLALNVLCGWQEEAASVGDALVKGLDTPMLDMRHTDRHTAGELCPHLWFLLQLYCNARQLPLDTSKYSYPPSMAPYAAVLSDWRTSETSKVATWVDELADFHLANTKPPPGFEMGIFDTEDVMLFPYEILTWLRLREWAGLTNPDSFDHPLMQLPTAQLPNPAPLPRPDTPLLDAVVAKFQQEFPGSFAP